MWPISNKRISWYGRHLLSLVGGTYLKEHHVHRNHQTHENNVRNPLHPRRDCYRQWIDEIVTDMYTALLQLRVYTLTPSSVLIIKIIKQIQYPKYIYMYITVYIQYIKEIFFAISNMLKIH